MRKIKFRAWDKKTKEMIYEGLEVEKRCLYYPDDPDREIEIFMDWIEGQK